MKKYIERHDLFARRIAEASTLADPPGLASRVSGRKFLCDLEEIAPFRMAGWIWWDLLLLVKGLFLCLEPWWSGGRGGSLAAQSA